MSYGRDPWWRIPVVAAFNARIERAADALLDVHGRLVLGYQSFLPDYIGVRSREPVLIRLAARSRLLTAPGVLLAHGVQIELGEGAVVSIGEASYLNPGACILSAIGIEIGARCAIAWGAMIMDFDGHELVAEGVPRPTTAPIKVEDHVWIGARATVLKGVCVGEGAVVGAGAVVTRDVPPRSVVVGSPARVIRTEVDWR